MFFEEPKMEILTFAKEDLVVASSKCINNCYQQACTNVCQNDGCTPVWCDNDGSFSLVR